MSWSLSFAVKGKAEAKDELGRRVAEFEKNGQPLPNAVARMGEILIDELPESGMDNVNTVIFSTYGHFRRDGDHPGTSNLTMAAQMVTDVGE